MKDKKYKIVSVGNIIFFVISFLLLFNAYTTYFDGAGEADAQSTFLKPLLIAIVGLILLALDILSIVMKHKMNKTHDFLRTRGQRVSAGNVTTETYEYEADQTTSWRIRAEWLDPKDNTVYSYFSDKLFFDPKPYLQETIEVFIDPKNPKIYEMDLSKLPTGKGEIV